MLGLLPLGGLGRSARYYAIERIKHDFVAAVAATNERARSRMPSVFVLDVGTNTGAFSAPFEPFELWIRPRGNLDPKNRFHMVRGAIILDFHEVVI